MFPAKGKILTLPTSMRGELKNPMGLLLKGEPSETSKKLRILVKKRCPPMFAVVGDFTAENIVRANMHPDIIVIDHRTMRIEVEPMNHGDRIVSETENPAGTITRMAWETLKHAVTLNNEISVIVEGEEDLLVLPLIMMMPNKSVIIYGQPHEGMVVVEVSNELKEWTRDFLNRMEEST
jgi:uncharacterized protein (UPF0218 family)